MNYFTLAEGKYFVDLPGYGYAKAPEAIRSQWEGLIGPYLSKRDQLAGLVVIMDIRRPMTDLDLKLIDDFRALWIQRNNAATRLHGMSYSVFMAGLKKHNIGLDRKALAEIAFSDADTFKALVQKVK